MKPSLRRTFGAPLVIGIISLIGLLAALLGDGGYDAASWIGLGTPFGVLIWAALVRRR